jgi:hypothetical protein
MVGGVGLRPPQGEVREGPATPGGGVGREGTAKPGGVVTSTGSMKPGGRVAHLLVCLSRKFFPRLLDETIVGGAGVGGGDGGRSRWWRRRNEGEGEM